MAKTPSTTAAPGKENAPGPVKVAWTGDVLEIAWSGRVRGDEVALALTKARLLLGESHPPLARILVNTLGVTGYELSVRGPSVEFLKYFQNHGVVEIVCIMPNTLVSMFAATMSLVTKCKFVVFRTSHEAFRHLAQAAPGAAVAR